MKFVNLTFMLKCNYTAPPINPLFIVQNFYKFPRAAFLECFIAGMPQIVCIEFKLEGINEIVVELNTNKITESIDVRYFFLRTQFSIFSEIIKKPNSRTYKNLNIIHNTGSALFSILHLYSKAVTSVSKFSQVWVKMLLTDLLVHRVLL